MRAISSCFTVSCALHFLPRFIISLIYLKFRIFVFDIAVASPRVSNIHRSVIEHAVSHLRAVIIIIQRVFSGDGERNRKREKENRIE